MTTRISSQAAPKGAGLTIALCFLVAAFEGFDIQAIGVAAPKLGAELQLAKDVLGQALAASNIGLVLGAAAGGWLADLIGRKLTLILASLIFGAFTLVTMVSTGFEMLYAARFAAGIGFGLALPNLMALASELSAPGRRSLTGTVMFCGMPLGGGTVALLSWLGGPNLSWRDLFLIGGIGPLVMAAVIWLLMKEARPARASSRARPSWKWLGVLPLYAVFLLAINAFLPQLAHSAPLLATLPTMMIGYMIAHRAALFGEGRALTSVLLWLTFIPTLLILYLVLNWLPTLIVGKGHPEAASQASVWFNYCSVAGAILLGWLVDKVGLRWPLVLAFAGVIVSLFGLANASEVMPLMLLSGALGFTLLGANYALYGAASSYYPRAVRGRGSGASVAWGRMGSVVGPLVGGSLLQGGANSSGVVMAMAPFAIFALISVLAVSIVAKPAAD